MATNIARNNPMVMAAMEKNIFEHISLMAQEQIELEFQDELQQIATDATDGSDTIHRCTTATTDAVKRLKQEKLFDC